jgi:hypothetical protein
MLRRLPAGQPERGRGIVALLGEAGLVQQAHAERLAVAGGDELLEPVPHRRFVPAVQPQELLQRPRRHARGPLPEPSLWKSHRLAA